MHTQVKMATEHATLRPLLKTIREGLSADWLRPWYVRGLDGWVGMGMGWACVRVCNVYFRDCLFLSL